TDDSDVRMAQSIMDYVFRRLALDYLDFDTRSALGIYSADERQRYLDTGGHQPVSDGTTSAGLVGGDAAPPQTESRTRGDDSESPEGGEARQTAELLEEITGGAIDSPLCMTCGTKMRPAGSCHVCEGCGSTSGCS